VAIATVAQLCRATSTRVERRFAPRIEGALAFQRVASYLVRAMADLIRRIAILIVSLALVVGPTTGGAQAASMDPTMGSAVTNDAHSAGICTDCGTTKSGMSVAACMAGYCSGLTAFPVDTVMSFEVRPVDAFALYDARRISGQTEAPDPHPPKATILN
jgi:hypothetical protein